MAIEEEKEENQVNNTEKEESDIFTIEELIEVKAQLKMKEQEEKIIKSIN